MAGSGPISISDEMQKGVAEGGGGHNSSGKRDGEKAEGMDGLTSSSEDIL